MNFKSLGKNIKISDKASIHDLYFGGLQRFFMNTGYWVSWKGYAITLAVTGPLAQPTSLFLFEHITRQRLDTA